MRLARTRFLKDRPLSRLIQHSTNGINLFMCPISERHIKNIHTFAASCKLDYAAKNPALTDNPAYSPDHLDELMHPILESSEASSCLEVHAPVPIRYLRMQIALRRPHMLAVLDAHRYLADHQEKTLDDAAEQICRKQAMITNQTKALRLLINPIINVYHLTPKNDLEEMILNGMSQMEMGRRLLRSLERGDVPANQSGASEALLRAYPSLHPILYPVA